MSLDIWLWAEVDLGGPEGPHKITLADKNITHNLVGMWRCAGVYDALYQSEGKKAADILPALEVGVDFMLENETECRKYDASNGWGCYEHALPFLQEMVEACRNFPKARIGVSR